MNISNLLINFNNLFHFYNSNLNCSYLFFLQSITSNKFPLMKTNNSMNWMW